MLNEAETHHAATERDGSAVPHVAAIEAALFREMRGQHLCVVAPTAEQHKLRVQKIRTGTKLQFEPTPQRLSFENNWQGGRLVG
jgi:hypothetical protein